MSFSRILAFVFGVVATISLLVFSAYTDPQNNQVENKASQGPKTTVVQNIAIPPIPDSVDFAGEALPLEHFDTKERFDRELLSNCFQHGTMIMNLKLSGRYFPLIEKILAKHGLPDDLKYLAVAESNLRNATSPAGAKGIWQFMPATAKEYGMLVQNDVDERYDVEKATEAACLLLKKLHQDFGSWSLAAAAYNMGPNGLRKNMEAQGVKNYFDLYLNPETSRYVFRIAAIKEIMKNPQRYGYNIDTSLYYPNFDQGQLASTNDPLVDWTQFAKTHGSSYRQIRQLNPWITASSLNNKTRKTFQVRIN